MKDFFRKFNFFNIVIIVVTFALPINLNAKATDQQITNPIVTTFVKNYEDPAKIDALLNTALTETSSFNSTALVTAVQDVVWQICTWPQLFQIKKFIDNNNPLLAKLPYVGLSTLYEFTTLVKHQIKQHRAKISYEASTNLKKACKIFQYAILKVIKNIKNGASTLQPSQTTTQKITIQELVNETCYTQLQDLLQTYLSSLVNSQITALSLELPQDFKATILSKENVTNLFNQALNNTVAKTLTTNEINTLKEFMQTSAVTTILTESPRVIKALQPKLAPLTKKWDSFKLV